jgi:hypothetical protein
LNFKNLDLPVTWAATLGGRASPGGGFKVYMMIGFFIIKIIDQRHQRRKFIISKMKLEEDEVPVLQ